MKTQYNGQATTKHRYIKKSIRLIHPIPFNSFHFFPFLIHVYRLNACDWRSDLCFFLHYFVREVSSANKNKRPKNQKSKVGQTERIHHSTSNLGHANKHTKSREKMGKFCEQCMCTHCTHSDTNK